MIFKLTVVTIDRQRFESNIESISFDIDKFNFESNEPFIIHGNPSFYINPKHIVSLTVGEEEK